MTRYIWTGVLLEPGGHRDVFARVLVGWLMLVKRVDPHKGFAADMIIEGAQRTVVDSTSPETILRHRFCSLRDLRSQHVMPLSPSDTRLATFMHLAGGTTDFIKEAAEYVGTEYGWPKKFGHMLDVDLARFKPGENEVLTLDSSDGSITWGSIKDLFEATMIGSRQKE
jgi:hypothetical protein